MDNSSIGHDFDVASAVLYRGRDVKGVFLRRSAYLIEDVLMTYHSDEDKQPTNVWQITPNCVVQPISQHSINVADNNWTALAAKILSKTCTVQAVCHLSIISLFLICF